MPIRSKAQRRWLYRAESTGEMPKGTAKKWQAHTPKGKKLPERVKKADAEADAFSHYSALRNTPYEPYALGAAGLLPALGGTALGLRTGRIGPAARYGLTGLGSGLGAYAGEHLMRTMAAEPSFSNSLVGGAAGAGIGGLGSYIGSGYIPYLGEDDEDDKEHKKRSWFKRADLFDNIAKPAVPTPPLPGTPPIGMKPQPAVNSPLGLPKPVVTPPGVARGPGVGGVGAASNPGDGGLAGGPAQDSPWYQQAWDYGKGMVGQGSNWLSELYKTNPALAIAIGGLGAAGLGYGAYSAADWLFGGRKRRRDDDDDKYASVKRADEPFQPSAIPYGGSLRYPPFPRGPVEDLSPPGPLVPTTNAPPSPLAGLMQAPRNPPSAFMGPPSPLAHLMRAPGTPQLQMPPFRELPQSPPGGGAAGDPPIEAEPESGLSPWLLAALGIPALGAAGYGGYKLYDWMTKKKKKLNPDGSEAPDDEEPEEPKEAGVKKAVGEGPPNLRSAEPLGPSCGSCHSFQPGGDTCSRFASQVNDHLVCDGYKSAEVKMPDAPEVSAPVKMSSSLDAFKAGFYLRCAEEGLTDLQTEERVKGLEKGATFWGQIGAKSLGGLGQVVGLPFDIIKKVVSTPFDMATKVVETQSDDAGDLAKDYVRAMAIAAVGAPMIGGAAGGYGLAKLHNMHDTEDADVLRGENLATEYQRSVAAARKKKQLENLQKHSPMSIVQIS